MTPAQLVIGWELFQRALTYETKDAVRAVRKAQHLFTPDGMQFAPIRSLRELADGIPFPAPAKDPVPHAKVIEGLMGKGWKLITEQDTGFDDVFHRWTDYCLSLAPDKPICNWRGNDPRTDRTFCVPEDMFS